MNNSAIKRSKQLALIAAMVVGVLFIVFVFKKTSTQKSETVYITNLTSCATNINPSLTDEIYSATYHLVKSANSYNKISTQPKYTATIRDKSCRHVSQNSSLGYDGKKQPVKTTSIVIDIPDAKQSWELSFDWVASKSINTDLGTIIPKCLPAESLIYGDFNCYKIMSLKEYGTDNYDVILQYMPYTGSGFDLGYNPETKEVTATIHIPIKEMDNQELIQNSREIVPYWFEHRGLDINNYTVIYKTSYQ